VRGAGWALSLLLTACSGIDGAEHTRVVPVGSGGFEFHAATDLFYRPDDDGWAEATRLTWLRHDPVVTGLCPHGYELVSREATFIYQSPLGDPVDDITYRGRCRG